MKSPLLLLLFAITLLAIDYIIAFFASSSLLRFRHIDIDIISLRIISQPFLRPR